MDKQLAVKRNRTPKSHGNPQTGHIMAVPQDLGLELVRMRHNPERFTARSGAKCKLCYKWVAFDLIHPDQPNAGTWCPVHGFLSFDSVALPPTERLKPHEIEERAEAEKRKAAWQKRQDKKVARS